MLTAKEIRDSFKNFFESKGHHIVPSAPMVIKDDPTLMLSLIHILCFVIRFSIYFDGLDIDIFFVYFGGQYGESLSICQM